MLKLILVYFQSPATYADTELEAIRLAEEIGAEYWPTSSKTGSIFIMEQQSVCFCVAKSQESIKQTG